MSVYYDPHRLREYAALTNSPIIYCLTQEKETHRIAGMWAYAWLVSFVNTGDPAAFHPHALRLIRESLPNWKNPVADVDDYQLFLREIVDAAVFNQLITQAIQEDHVLYLDKSTAPWSWRLSQVV
jgi:hypothetical protein